MSGNTPKGQNVQNSKRCPTLYRPENGFPLGETHPKTPASSFVVFTHIPNFLKFI